MDNRFYRLPIQVDSERLRGEVESIDACEWVDHPNGYVGNSALPLISVNGQDNHDVAGAMAPCPRTVNMPYLMQVIASLGTLVGRSRLMRLGAGCNVPRHCDINLYWRKRMRIHIPIVTNSSVLFESAGQIQHLGEGEVWVLDTWHNHSVTNQGAERIHLVVDTIGSPKLWSMLEHHAWKPCVGELTPPANFKAKSVRVETHVGMPQLALERFNIEPVLHPSEVKEILAAYVADMKHESSPNDRESPGQILADLSRNWQVTWVSFGAESQHHIRYRLLVMHAIDKLTALKHQPHLDANQQSLVLLLGHLIKGLAEQKIIKSSVKKTRKPPEVSFEETTAVSRVDSSQPFDPVFIVAAPRSGSSLLYETLGCHEQLAHYDAESHGVIESVPSLSVAHNGSNQLYATQATSAVSQQLKQRFIDALNQRGKSARSHQIFLEKTPKNALRVAFLKAAFPTARFIYLFRRPQQNISSIIDGWRSGRFVTYQNLEGWQSDYSWSFLLPEGWRYLPRNDLASIASYQYRAANQAIINDLVPLHRSEALTLSYEDFVQHPRKHMQQICHFLNLPWSSQFDKELQRPTGLKLSKNTLCVPDEDKWRANEEVMQGIMPTMQDFFDTEILAAAESINIAEPS
ncbi:sulfotransferase [Arenicella xantha]|uniref:sulfotransferase n=1 Tax=Arenicella xantha TaxID=644221 RepID=UPI001472C05A|nr:sulfotransferase [Arenicella xantha]